ncbi:adenosylhomocysteinase [Mesorhizobium sp. M7A.F.Ca.CA.001.07.2.1]|uniref:adenosylhomocysteinase n=4 Tax=Phyllobacteriaceae TaxID=69277 RepID=UPI000FCAD99D|nr:MULTISPECIES: adenosylhomocysteinase [Mesorhizobium]MCF6122002.1 adenosylhomocysteinase [Mesorhizobium ciceri]MCQ8812583.1 adenosylhomocysteinase [Mesorhizobium sp. SEMIA396]RUX72919.1 adenosylhomocysteinase [Mesorhizobium sp. M7A.F.Ca.CA.004.08.2.1]RUX83380.1 adenosylhomocysteinase [Mesorhizobium sp. M7A.F.Ca.CA.004.08.1.1]RUX99793.1 adenosylhomocysteinase [Mesorhizobium sp. M7A.F.Ca.CA.004.04.1.1]
MTQAKANLANPELVERGRARIAWIRSRMAMLATLRSEFRETQPFAGRRIGVSLHVEPKTAVLLEVLAEGGAEIVGTGNHGSTQDDVVAFLQSQGIGVFGSRADTLADHHANLARVLDAKPDMLLDNGADLAAGIIERGWAASILGGTEETTSGGDRLRGELAGKVPFPSIVINDSPLKAIGENKHAVGQSVVESFMRITNLMIPGRRFCVIGYGWCGRGIAQYLRALGGRVAVVEVDEIKALEAALDGYRVAPLADLAPWAQVFITATGRAGVLPASAIAAMQDGAVLANSGHFPWEIDTEGMRAMTTGSTDLDGTLQRLDLANGRHVILVADGRMFNLAGSEPKGNSIESMDIGFMLQALSLERVVKGATGERPAPGAQPVPDDINQRIARLMMATMGAAL